MKSFLILFFITFATGGSAHLNPNEYPCGTFMKYDTVNGVNDPALYGLFGGNNFDGQNEYVGYGDNFKCNQIPSSGFISTEKSAYSKQGPGAYLPCGSGISFDDKNAYYLLKSSKLEWVASDNAAMLTLANVVKVKGNEEFAFGRVYRRGKYRVGKLHLSSDEPGLYVQTRNDTEENYESGFEILTCVNDEKTTKNPKPISSFPTTFKTPVTPPLNDTNSRGQRAARGSVLTAQNCLWRGDYLVSPRNCFRMVMQNDGNLVIYRQSDSRVIWATNTNGRGGYKVCQQVDGNFVLSTSSSQPIWATGTNGRFNTYAFLQDNAELAIQDNSWIYWGTQKYYTC